MQHYPKAMHKVTTERVVGFGAAVRLLGTHEVCGTRVHYTPTHVRMVLNGTQKSAKLLNIIAEKCPAMFDICRLSDDVKAWWDEKRKEVSA